MNNQHALESLHSHADPLVIHDRDHILELIKAYRFTGSAVEVGTFNGTFANEILEKTDVAHLSCVDPYAIYPDFRDAINDMDIEAIFAQAQRFLSRFDHRVAFIRDFSSPASRAFKDESLDFVYVDGNHQSDYVLQDLLAWWPKVKVGGLIIGDDCVDLDDSLRNSVGDVTLVHRRRADGTPDLYGDYGVFHALRRFCGDNNLGYMLMGSQFVIPK